VSFATLLQIILCPEMVNTNFSLVHVLENFSLLWLCS
jgi:hypothetical protein